MTQAYWFEHKEQGGFPVLRAAVGDCDLSVLQVGDEWQWLVRRDRRATLPRAPPALPTMHSARPKPRRSRCGCRRRILAHFRLTGTV